MACTKCKSERVASINGKCDDRFSCSVGDTDKDGYVPYDMAIGGGDYIKLEYCLDCGQIQGEFPLPKTELEESSEEDEDY